MTKPREFADAKALFKTALQRAWGDAPRKPDQDEPNFTNQETHMFKKINETALRNHCIAKHGEIMGAIAFDMELKVQRANLARYHDLHRQRDEAVAESTRRQAGLPSLDPLREGMNTAYAVWLSACEALENQRIANIGALNDVQTKIDDLNAAIAQFMSPVQIDPWKKSDLFIASEVPSMHESTMRFQNRVDQLKVQGYSSADAQRIARNELGVNRAGVPA